MLTLHLQADTLNELRAQAILALDIRTLSHEQATAKVAELQSEFLTEEEAQGADSTKGTLGVPVEQLEREAAEHDAEIAAQKPAKKTRAKKAEKPAGTIAAFAQEIEQQADAEMIDLVATKPDKLTLESVRSAFDQYVQRFGVQAAQIDGPILLGRVFGNEIARIKDVPETDQTKLARIIAAVEGAILTNEFKRPAVQ